MDILDLRTLVTINIVTRLVCALVMAIVWNQNHKRYPATGFWLVSFVMQFFAQLLIVFRGTIPDFFSITVSGVLVILGLIQLYAGLTCYVGKVARQRQNYALLIVFVAIHAYSTYVEPSLLHRNILYSVVVVLIMVESAAVLLFRVEPARQPGTALVGWVLAIYILLNFGRLVAYIFLPPGNDLFHAGLYDALMYFSYQILTIALTFSLILMVNRRMHAELEADVETFKRSESAIRLSEARLERAELAAKSGNWELHLDTNEIIASPGASKVYGVDVDRFSYETIKALPLSEYRPLLDTALTNLIQHGLLYDVDFRIQTADTAETKDIHSMATFDPRTRTVFGVIQDVSDRKKVERELEQLAQTDLLTGIPNRRHFLALAEQELSRKTRYGGDISVLMIDVDNFASVEI